MNDFFHLLAELDIGRASFIALVALVFWLGREMVKVLRRIEQHVARGNLIQQQTRDALDEFVGVLRRRGIEIRTKEEVKP
ncbi:hypothetical protein [Oceanithermus sp.]|uniref:hypothetical protein n=1 Tax=Oceanithermus sp. TaxID=2268145 RepID=UPI0025EC052C|nr:hypothetical protein [Oceanithermus sp.]